MLPKAYRIVKSEDIKQAYKGKFRTTAKLVNIIIDNRSQGNFRLLVVVSKKIHKSACIRNKIKRRVHSIFRELKQQNKLFINTFCIIQVKSKEIIYTPYTQIQSEISQSFQVLSDKISSYQSPKRTLPK